jgi:hypothetical protein
MYTISIKQTLKDIEKTLQEKEYSSKEEVLESIKKEFKKRNLVIVNDEQEAANICEEVGFPMPYGIGWGEKHKMYLSDDCNGDYIVEIQELYSDAALEKEDWFYTIDIINY